MKEDKKATTRCKACDSKFSPRIIDDWEEDMCSKCIGASRFFTDVSEDYEFIRGFMEDKTFGETYGE